MPTRPSLRLVFSLLTFVLLCVPVALHASDPTKSLNPRFRHWINEEVPYIIETQERREFLALKTDQERENFIQAFWEARNPTPHSEMNSYKEEYYARLSYANQHFGSGELQDGWRTDQGRIYITLGPPQQKALYPNSQNVRPMIIWFYQSPTPALATHFYIVFYKRSAGDPYTLYSPYQDGPSRLTTGLEAMNDQKKSLQIIRKALGDEVARTTLTLLPTEPADLNDYSPSMTSDVLLSTIKGLADNPLNKEMIDARRGKEVTSARILMSPKQAEMQAISFREAGGGQIAYYLLAPHESMSNLIGVLPDGKKGYSLTLQTTVTTRAGVRVYGAETGLQGEATEEQVTNAKDKRFVAEERLPLAPGEYKVSATLTNNLNHVALQELQTVLVPDLKEDPWNMSGLLLFTDRSAVEVEGKVPFSVAGVRFAPRGVNEVWLHPSDPLWVAFQLWARPAKALPAEAPAAPRHITITYTYGTLQTGQSPTIESEEVDASNVDSSGNLLTGHKIDTSKLEMGAYRLVVTATDVQTHRKTYSSTAFHIVPWQSPTDVWNAYFTDGGGKRSDAMDDYKRGLSALAQSKNETAEAWFQRSLADDKDYLPALDRLVDVLTRTSHFADVAALSKDHPVSRDLREQTAILMAQANGQVGHGDDGIRILEQELQFQAPNSALYLALAKLYQAGGDVTKAADFKRKAEALSTGS